MAPAARHFFDVELLRGILDGVAWASAVVAAPWCCARKGGTSVPASTSRGRRRRSARPFALCTITPSSSSTVPCRSSAAVQGSAVGGGLGLAAACDLRVASPVTRFSANFARLGLHHGFGLSLTLPEIVGHQRALRCSSPDDGSKEARPSASASVIGSTTTLERALACWPPRSPRPHPSRCGPSAPPSGHGSSRVSGRRSSASAASSSGYGDHRLRRGRRRDPRSAGRPGSPAADPYPPARSEASSSRVASPSKVPGRPSG